MAWAFSRLLFQAKTELTQWPILAVDVVFLALLTWIGMRSRRFWPLFAAGFQLLGVVSHLARAADPRVTGWAYLTAELAFSYMVLITLGYASWTAPARYAVTSDPVAEPGATLR